MRVTRREFLASGLGWLLPWNWFRRDPEIAGIRFQQLKRGNRPRRYLWIHGNEKTALGVLTTHMERVQGRAFLVRSFDRYVPIAGGRIDPNRMFSRVGAERSLISLNPKWSTQQVQRALSKLEGDREDFLETLLPKSGDVIVALHNNGPAYSVHDEISISDLVALNDKEHPDEFMLCTQRPDFQILAGGPFNVVLQNTAPKEDDGSLSRLCAARGVRYVNIEAAHGNSVGQRRMLEWLEAVL